MNETKKALFYIGGTIAIALVVWIYCLLSKDNIQGMNTVVSPQSSERYSPGTTDTLTTVHSFRKKSSVMKLSTDKQQQPDSTAKIYETEISDSLLSLQLELLIPGDSLPPVISVSGNFQQMMLSRTDTLIVTNTNVVVEDTPWYDTFAAGAAATIILCLTIIMVTK